jgi:hypothetical protein
MNFAEWLLVVATQLLNSKSPWKRTKHYTYNSDFVVSVKCIGIDVEMMDKIMNIILTMENNTLDRLYNYKSSENLDLLSRFVELTITKEIYYQQDNPFYVRCDAYEYSDYIKNKRTKQLDKILN